MHKAFRGIWSIADSILFILGQHLLCLQNYQKQSCHNCHQRTTTFPWKSASYIWHSLSSLLWEPFAAKRNGNTVKWNASLQYRTTTEVVSQFGRLKQQRRWTHLFFSGPTEKKMRLAIATKKKKKNQPRSNSKKGSRLENILMIFINLSKHLQLLLFPAYNPKHLTLYWTHRDWCQLLKSNLIFSNWTVLLKGDFKSARWQSNFSPSAKNQANEVFLCKLWALHCDANFPNYKNWAGPVL